MEHHERVIFLLPILSFHGALSSVAENVVKIVGVVRKFMVHQIPTHQEYSRNNANAIIQSSLASLSWKIAKVSEQLYRIPFKIPSPTKGIL